MQVSSGRCPPGPSASASTRLFPNPPQDYGKSQMCYRKRIYWLKGIGSAQPWGITHTTLWKLNRPSSWLLMGVLRVAPHSSSQNTAKSKLRGTEGGRDHRMHYCHTVSWVPAGPLANHVALDKEFHPSEPLLPLLYHGKKDSKVRKTIQTAKESSWHVSTVQGLVKHCGWDDKRRLSSSLSRCGRYFILTDDLCAPHISGTPCSGCSGIDVSWWTVGEGEVGSFLRWDNEEYNRESPFSFLLCDIDGGGVLTQGSHKTEAALLTRRKQATLQSHPVFTGMVLWARNKPLSCKSLRFPG